MAANDPIFEFLPRWHAQFGNGLASDIEALIADDAVFYSPVVFKAQEGKALTAMYLQAAGKVFAGEGHISDHFRYVKEIASGNQAMLEFESTVDGILINGVDIITLDDAGLIKEFKVMVRPFKAIDLLRGKMLEMLESMQA